VRFDDVVGAAGAEGGLAARAKGQAREETRTAANRAITATATAVNTARTAPMVMAARVAISPPTQTMEASRPFAGRRRLGPKIRRSDWVIVPLSQTL